MTNSKCAMTMMATATVVVAGLHRIPTRSLSTKEKGDILTRFWALGVMEISITYIVVVNEMTTMHAIIVISNKQIHRIAP